MKHLLTLFISTVALGSAHAATVNWGADTAFDTVLQDSTGALLRVGSLAQIGFFSLTDSQIQALASPTPSNISALNAAFTPFGNARVGNGFDNTTIGVPDPGGFTAGSSGSQALAGNQIYYWVLKSTNDLGTPAASVSSGFEQAIFYRNKLVDSAWAFPTDLQTPPTIDTGNLRGAGGNISAGSVVLAGSYITNSIPGAIYNGQPTSAIQLQGLAAPVPEPSAFVFGLLAGVGALCRRHRRAKA